MANGHVFKQRTVANTPITCTQLNPTGLVSTFTFNSQNVQKILTRSNGWRSRGRNSPPNVGSSFWSKRIDVDLNPLYVDYHASVVQGRPANGVKGGLVCDVNTSNWMPTTPGNLTTWGAADYYGAVAVSRCAPTNSHADLTVALAELKREGLPRSALLSGASRGTSMTKKAADDYLGYQFGVKPLVGDVKSTVSALRDSSAILQQYARDGGRLVRRRYEFPEEQSMTSSTVSNCYPYVCSYVQVKPFTATITTTTRRRTWFSGAFTYKPLGNVENENYLNWIQDNARKANHLLGLRVTPDVFWNLLPWSWLVDWHSNVGDVLHNISMYQTDGLVMVYGYIMQTVETTRTVVMTGGELKGISSWAVTNHPSTVTTVEKVRRPANPFGFGISPASLNARQWSILAALGISKGSAKTLRNDPEGL